MNKAVDKIEQAMRYVYAHFMEPEEAIEDMLTSHRHPFPSIRHVIRERIYHRMAPTLRQIGMAEGRISGQKSTHHSTIGNSVQLVRGSCDSEDRQGFNEVAKLLNEFEDYWVGQSDPRLRNRLRHYYQMPHHVLAVIVTFAEQFGGAQRNKMDGLHTEFKTVSRKFVENEIKATE